LFTFLFLQISNANSTISIYPWIFHRVTVE
jgi:hypothetical protein